jgi:hypothetical protein
LRRLIITLTLTLTAFSVSIGQNFKKDIENGLYLSSPDWIFVQQLVSDTLKSFKLIESRYHYDKVAQVLFDSIPKRQIFKPRKSKRDLGKMNDLLKLNKNQYSIIYSIDSGFNAYNFIKKDIGYEMYFSKHKVDKKDLVKSITHDTTDYFTFCAFTLADIKELKKLKDFNSISQADFDALTDYMEKNKTRYLKQLKDSKVKSMYGTVETNEILVKVLLALKYNPMLVPGDFDKVYKKYRPKR